MAQVAIFKEIFDHMKKDLDCEIVLSSEIQTSQRLIIFTI